MRYALRNLARNRTRTFLGAGGILLTLALLAAIQIGLDSVSTSYIDLVALQAGKADLLVAAEGGDPLRPLPFDPAPAVERAGRVPSLRGLTPRLVGIVQLAHGGNERWAVLLGIDPGRERELDILGLTPEPELAGGKCALSQALARSLAAGAGDSLRARSAAGEDDRVLQVEALLERQLVLPQEIQDFVVADLATARAVLGVANDVHYLAGAFRDPRSYYDARDLHESVLRLKDAGEEVAEALGTPYDVRLPKAAAIAAFERFSSPASAAFGVFAVFALAIAGLLVYSLISVGVEERIREHAILRTLGARRRSIFALVLTESALLCLAGVVPGVVVGTGFALLVVRLVEAAMGATGSTVGLELSGGTLARTLAAGVVLAVGSALLPALRAMRTRIVDGLDPLRRGQVRVETTAEGGPNRPLLLTGLALSALSVVVFFVLPSAFLSGDASVIGTVVLCLLLTILLGFTLVAVGVLPWVERLVVAATGWAYGLAGELATRNLARHRRRHTTTALMFTLCVAFVIFVASLVALFSRTALAMVEQTNGADLHIQTGDPEALGLAEEMKKIPGVRGASEAAFLRHRSQRGIAYDVVLSDVVGMKDVWVVPFGVDRGFPDVLYLPQVGFEEGDRQALERLVADDGAAAPEADPPPVVLSQAAARYLDLHVGDPVQLSFRLGSQRSDARFRVAAVVSCLPGFPNFRSRVAAAVGSGVLLSQARFDAMTERAPREAFQALYLVRTGDGPGEQLAAAAGIRERFGGRYRFGLKSSAEQKQHARVLYWATQVFFGLLMAVAVVIAVFALIASMATAVIERRWEIGVLKALGLRRGQLFRMFLGEAVTLTLSAGAAGGVIGFSLAWLFAFQAAALIEMPLAFTMPYLTFAATFAISVVAGAFAAYLPTRRILRRNAAEILRDGR